ncbi:hypothetical protein ACHAXS_013069 [Conticribra weissflogii]
MSDPYNISFNERGPSGGDATTASSVVDPARGSSITNAPPNEDLRIRQLRLELGAGDDVPTEVLQAILDADRQEESSAAAAAASAAAVAPTPPSYHRSGSSTVSSGIHTRGRRTWENCQPAPSRPGAFSVGDISQYTDDDYPVGPTLTEEELMEKRINAVHRVQESLKERLGRELNENGEYEKMEKLYEEGEEECAKSELERRMERGEWIGPKPTLPKCSEELMAKFMTERAKVKERVKLRPIEEPLPLPMSLMGGVVGAGGSSADEQDRRRGAGGAFYNNPEICIGKFVDPGPDKNDEEEKREEVNSLDYTSASKDSSTWQDVSVDDSPMGPYDKIVRCWKCRAGLRVPFDMGLVCCPRCRSISPATDIANVAIC